MGSFRVTDRHGERHTLKSAWYAPQTIAQLRGNADRAHMRALYVWWLAARDGTDEPEAAEIVDSLRFPAVPYTVENLGEVRGKRAVTMPAGWVLYSDWYKPDPISRLAARGSWRLQCDRTLFLAGVRDMGIAATA